MGRKCSLKICKNYQDEFSRFAFHVLPRDVHTRKRWLDAIPNGLLRENIKDITICSAHFSIDNYCSPMGYTKRILKKTATPNIFDCHEIVNDSDKENTGNFSIVQYKHTSTAVWIDSSENRTTELPFEQDETTAGCSSENHMASPFFCEQDRMEIRREKVDAEVQTSCKWKLDGDEQDSTKRFRNSDEREKVLWKRICTLKQRLRRREAKLSSMKRLLQGLLISMDSSVS